VGTEWRIFCLVNLRHLFGRRRRTALTVLGVSASVALVVAISVINETLRTAIDRTTTGLAGAASLEVAPATGERLQEGSLLQIANTPGVAAAVPITRQVTILRDRARLSRTLVFGVPSNLEVLFPDGLEELSRQLANTDFRTGALLSEGLAQTVDASPGDRVTLRTATGPKQSEVIGVFAHSPFAAINGGSFALLPLVRAQLLFGQGQEPSFVYVMHEEGIPRTHVTRLLQRRLGPMAVVRPPGSATSAYQKVFDSIASISEQARGVALLVALFLVFNTMSMSLAERRREVAMLALGGAQPKQVMAAFIAEAAILGAIGSAIGIVGGVGLGSLLVQRSVDAYAVLPFVSSGPLQVSVATILLGVGAGISVAIAGALIPARKILRIEPIEALRPEASYEWSRSHSHRTILLALVGALLVLGMAAIVAFGSIGSDPWIVGVVFALVFFGSALLLPILVSTAAGALWQVFRALFGMIGRLAADSLLRNPARATITAGALTLSAAVVIAVGSSLGSYSRAVDKATSAWYVAPLYVNAPGSVGYRSDQPLPNSLGRSLARVPGVKAAYPTRFGVIDNGGTQTIVYAMPIAEAARNGESISKGVGISQEMFTRSLARGEVVISRHMAQRRHLIVGQTLNLPGITRVRIGGLFNEIAPIDSLYVELADYQRVTGDKFANRFSIVTGSSDLSSVARRLRLFLRERQIPASVLTRDEIRAEVSGSIDSLFSLARGTQIAALLIAGLLVLNTMVTATFERQREFGLQRTLGMSRAQLAGSVILEALAMTIIGALCAVGLGLGFGLLMTLTIESRLSWEVTYVPDVLTAMTAVGATLVIGTVAALYPSWLATRQRLIGLVQIE
jgi:putative ABC transport system permease protein